MDRRATTAALVGAVGATVGVAGAGHAYLRRWRRAAAWFSAVLGLSLALIFAFTDPQTVTAATLPPTVVGPVVALLLTSVGDAYLAGRHVTGARHAGTGEGDPSCPVCGRELDPALDFCWYCSAPVDGGGEEATSR